jgi:4-hydroxy-2-oxoglutarate aldolase
MAQLDLKGIFPPIPTPFENGKVAHEKLAFNIEKWSKTGIKGVVALGSNGEYVYLSEEEKRKVIETVVRSTPKGLPVIAGTGCEATAETIRLTQDCAEIGAHGALVVTPSYYGGRMDERAMIGHFSEVADHSPVPILLYNVPKFTHINLPAKTVAELSRHPNIVGIKDSSGNVNQLGEYLNAVEMDFHVLVGNASALLGALSLGCTGAILALANIAPHVCVRIQSLVNEDDFQKAAGLQLKMIPVNNAVTTTYGVGGLKAAMDMLGYFGGDPRMPLCPATENEKDAIRQILTAAELL